MRTGLVVFVLIICCFFACERHQKSAATDINYKSKPFQDKLIEANKMYVRRESDEIDQYIAHKGWQMTRTGTGLRYQLLKKGNGTQAKPGQMARVNYKISLLDGTVCYSSDSTGARDFIIAGDNVESGLHEAIQYMHVGDKAIFILPSYMAHGLVGDEQRIPPQASLVYELELLSLKERVEN